MNKTDCEVTLDFAGHEELDAIEQESRAARFATFDIETGPLPADQLESLITFFEPPEHPGEFDPTSVKCGRLTEPKKLEKIEAERIKHAAAIDNYDVQVADAFQAHRDKFMASAALSALTGRVLAAGLLITDVFHIFTAENEDEERELLQSYWDAMLEYRDHLLVGFNIHDFDLPFLVTRSWITGVRVPHFVHTGRYWSDLFLDLRLKWTFGDHRKPGTLGAVAGHLGCGSKSGDGADFSATFFSDRPSAIEYLKNDLRLTRRVGTRLGVR